MTDADEMIALAEAYATAGHRLGAGKPVDLSTPYVAMKNAIREICEERDRLREELAAAHQQIFDLTLKVNNPAWLPGI